MKAGIQIRSTPWGATKPLAIATALTAWLSAPAPIACISAAPRSLNTPANAPATELGFKNIETETIFGGNTKEEASKIFRNILEGKGTYEQNAVVLANAAKALQNTGKYENYETSLAAAKESLESGKALECLNKLIIK